VQDKALFGGFGRYKRTALGQQFVQVNGDTSQPLPGTPEKIGDEKTRRRAY